MCPAYALREEHTGTVEIADGDSTREVPRFGGGLLASPAGDFDVAKELANGDGTIVVPDDVEHQGLIVLLDAYPALKRVAAPPQVDAAKGYESYSLAALRQEASRRGLAGLGSKPKADVIAALEQFDNERGED